MATQKQIQANRLNARNSTGPRSAEGKAVSSQNALQSGIDAQSQIIRGEQSGELAALAAQYLRDHQPRTAAERALVDIMIDSEWLLRRMRKVEAHLWENEIAAVEEKHLRWHSDEPKPVKRMLGRAFQESRETFVRLERRRDYLHRTYHRALHDLRELQASRAPVGNPAESPEPLPAAPPTLPPTPSSQRPNQEIGFVPENPPAAPALAPGLPPAAPPEPACPSTPQSASSRSQSHEDAA